MAFGSDSKIFHEIIICVHLTSPNSWARGLVLAAAVEVENTAGIVSGIGAWESNQWAWSSISAAGNLDLTACNVNLGLSGVVESNMLDANEVVAAGGGLWYREGKVLLV